MKLASKLICASICVCLAACGGGGSGTLPASSGAPPVPNSGPAVPGGSDAVSGPRITEHRVSDTLIGGLTIGTDGSLYATTPTAIDVFSASSLQSIGMLTIAAQAGGVHPDTWPAVGHLVPTGAINGSTNGTVSALAQASGSATPQPGQAVIDSVALRPALVIYTIATGLFDIAYGTPNDTYHDLTEGPSGYTWVAADRPTAHGLSGFLVTTKPGCSQTFFTGAIGSITEGSDGDIWVGTDPSLNGATPSELLRVNPASGAIVGTFKLPPGSRIAGLANGPDGALWFTDSGLNEIGRITTGGQVTYYPVPLANSGLAAITADSDGALWFTQTLSNTVGRITTAGVVTEFAVPTPNAGLGEIVACPCGTLYFTEQHAIGKITP
ncbi:MAG: hypothetical protein M3R35_02805 [Candidatus Eremiobacteraeota bacterium]|nr:hypothetical protein [Candidatus Eremiobacteraeota bacterium]